MSDYIEREALTKGFKIWQNTLIETYGKNDEYVRCLDSVLLGIDNVPATDVRPVVRGKWEDVEVTYVADKTTLPFERISSMRCNQCNRYHTEIYYYGNPTEMANYCPNCGADMREES